MMMGMNDTALTKVIVNKDNIRDESYYNLCRIAASTRYPNPLSALATTGESVMCEKDSQGNIFRCELIKEKA